MGQVHFMSSVYKANLNPTRLIGWKCQPKLLLEFMRAFGCRLAERKLTGCLVRGIRLGSPLRASGTWTNLTRPINNGVIRDVKLPFFTHFINQIADIDLNPEMPTWIWVKFMDRAKNCHLISWKNNKWIRWKKAGPRVSNRPNPTHYISKWLNHNLIFTSKLLEHQIICIQPNCLLATT